MKLSLKELANKTKTTLIGDPEYEIEGINDLKSATTKEVSFFSRSPFEGPGKSLKPLEQTKAGIVIIPSDITPPSGRCYLVSSNPSQTFQQVVKWFFPPIPSGFEKIHPSAVIHPSAHIEEDVHIGPNAVIDQGVKIGKGTIIDALVFIGAKTQIGNNCRLFARSVVREGCILKDNVILQPGAVIGSCGFGYTTNEKGEHQKIEQLGNVVIESDVEIGANTCIDRARIGSTIIDQGSKIDNLVQVAHGVHIGQHNLIAGQTGFAGSTKTGKYNVFGGQVAVKGHLEFGDQIVVAARSGVIKSLLEPGTYIGEPAIPYADYRRHWMHLLKLGRYADKIKEHNKRLKEIESKIDLNE